MRKECLEEGAKDDGEFWMDIEDMKKHYTHFEVCSVSMDELHEDDSGMYISLETQSCAFERRARHLHMCVCLICSLRSIRDLFFKHCIVHSWHAFSFRV